tara:strand:+ start:327 stop:737 length:411 start_codon:yes stop_codon:yes gene_type:complete
MENIKQNMINKIINNETKKINNNFNQCYDFLIDFIKLLTNEITDTYENNIHKSIYFIDNDIYKNNLINSYINDNLTIIKQHFYTTNLRQVLKSKKLPNQLLKHMLKSLNIEFKQTIKAVKKPDGKLTTKSVMIVEL